MGPSLKARLKAAGIITAADVEYRRVSRVDGIGTNKANALVYWRNHLASYANVPKALNQSETASIKAKYAAKKQQLESQLNTAQQRMNTEGNSIKTKAAEQVRLMSSEQTEAQNKANQQLQVISEKYKMHYRTIAQTRSSAISGFNERRRKVEEEIIQLKKGVGEKSWQLAKIRRNLTAYKEVSFIAYLRAVIRVDL